MSLDFEDLEVDQEATKQIDTNTLKLLNQMDSTFEQSIPSETNLNGHHLYQANMQICENNYKPKRTSRLFGVEIYDLQDVETCLTTSDLSHFANGQTTRVFFPAAQKLFSHTSVFDGYQDCSHPSFGTGHLFKNFHSVWARDMRSLDELQTVQGQDFSIN